MKQEAVIFVGHLANNIDITAEGNRKETFGGSAYYTGASATLVKKEDQIIGVVGRVGEDDFGRQIISALTSQEVDVRGVEIGKDEKTAWFELTEVGETSSRRGFRGSLGAGEKTTLSFPESYKQAVFIHLATAPPKQQLEWISKISPQLSKNTKITVDAFEAYAREFPEETYHVLNMATGYIFLNEEEWEAVEKWGQADHKFKHLSFSIPAILKQGAHGATIIYPDGQRRSVSAKEMNYVNGTGAGETLTAVFLTLKTQGVDYVSALEKAVELASLSVTDFGVDHLFKK